MPRIPTRIKDEKLVEKRREQIVEGAIKLFAEKGFFRSTLDELAEVSGLSHGSIYAYINTKEDIFSLIHDVLYRHLDEEITKTYGEPDDPIKKLHQLVRADFNLMDHWAKTILLLYQESHILNKERLKDLLAKEREHISKYEAVLEECIQKGVFRKINVRLVANLIKLMLDAWAIKQWDLKDHVTRKEMEKAILDLLTYGLTKDRGNGVRSKQKRTSARKA
jgi:AcrR family transcriptional regulator